MVRDCCCCIEWRQVVVMLAVDVGYAVMNTLIKQALEQGIDKLVLITLRQLLATLLMAPLAYFYERKNRPKLTLEIWLYLFFASLFGTTLTQYLFFLGMHYTSTTFTCAFLNIAPVITFLISLAMRLETLNLMAVAGKAKALGTTICLVGVVLLMMYRGAPLTKAPVQTTQPTAAEQLPGTNAAHHSPEASGRWLMGSFAALASCACWSLWFPLQYKLGKKYPALYSSTALMFFLGFLQALALSLATNRSFSVWLLKTELEIVSAVFSGIVGSGVCLLAMSWCVKKRGPVFTAAFTPFVQIMVGVLGISFLHEQIYLGSVLWSILVVVGLYLLLWGKNLEARGLAVAVNSAENNGEKSNQAHADHSVSKTEV